MFLRSIKSCCRSTNSRNTSRDIITMPETCGQRGKVEVEGGAEVPIAPSLPVMEIKVIPIGYLYQHFHPMSSYQYVQPT